MKQFNQEAEGGGSGGGGTGMTDDGNNLQSCTSTYQISGNQVVLMSRKPLPSGIPDNPEQTASSITLLAAGGLPDYSDDGEVDIRGVKRVRITSGEFALPLVAPPTNSQSTNGVDVIVACDQSINLCRGNLLNQQVISMTKDGIVVNGGATGKVTLTAGEQFPGAPTIVLDATGITMAVGMSQIVINTQGINITGMPLVNINPSPPTEPLPPLLPNGDLWA